MRSRVFVATSPLCARTRDPGSSKFACSFDRLPQPCVSYNALAFRNRTCLFSRRDVRSLRPRDLDSASRQRCSLEMPICTSILLHRDSVLVASLVNIILLPLMHVIEDPTPPQKHRCRYLPVPQLNWLPVSANILLPLALAIHRFSSSTTPPPFP